MGNLVCTFCVRSRRVADNSSPADKISAASKVSRNLEDDNKYQGTSSEKIQQRREQAILDGSEQLLKQLKVLVERAHEAMAKVNLTSLTSSTIEMTSVVLNSNASGNLGSVKPADIAEIVLENECEKYYCGILTTDLINGFCQWNGSFDRAIWHKYGRKVPLLQLIDYCWQQYSNELSIELALTPQSVSFPLPYSLLIKRV